MPHSELVMFQEKELKDGERVKTRYAHGLASAAFEFSDESTLLANQSDFDNVAVGPYVGTHLIFMRQNGAAFSATVGNGFGLDLTLPLIHDIYITQSFSHGLAFENFQSSLQTIIQRRLYDGNPVGLSIGINYQLKNSRIDGFPRFRDDCPGYASYFVACHNFIPRHSIGIRSVMTFSFQPRDHIPSKQMLYGAVNLNYDLSFGFFYPMLSISTVIH